MFNNNDSSIIDKLLLMKAINGSSSSGGGETVNADWDAEEGQPGYINNRPFYENDYLLSEDTVEEEDWSGQILLTGQEAISNYVNDYYTTHGSLVGAILTLKSSTESYSLPYNVEEGVFLYISPSMSISVGAFPPDFTVVMLGESENIGLLPTGDLTLYSHEIKKIDEKFLPEVSGGSIYIRYHLEEIDGTETPVLPSDLDYNEIISLINQGVPVFFTWVDDHNYGFTAPAVVTYPSASTPTFDPTIQISITNTWFDDSTSPSKYVTDIRAFELSASTIDEVTYYGFTECKIQS